MALRRPARWPSPRATTRRSARRSRTPTAVHTQSPVERNKMYKITSRDYTRNRGSVGCPKQGITCTNNMKFTCPAGTQWERAQRELYSTISRWSSRLVGWGLRWVHGGSHWVRESFKIPPCCFFVTRKSSQCKPPKRTHLCSGVI